MNNKFYFLLTFVLLLFSFVFVSGCGKYVKQYSAPVIIERYPAIGAGGIGTAEILWLKFSKAIDANNYGAAEIASKLLMASDMTATVTTYPALTAEGIWSEDYTKLSIYNLFLVAASGAKVHIQGQKEAFLDVNGIFLPENTELWSFDLSGLNIVGRFPPIDGSMPNSDISHEVNFNNSLATLEVFVTSNHTAGTSEPLQPVYYLSDSDRKITFEVSFWQYGSSTVEVTYEARDIFGNEVKNGQFLHYHVQ